MPVLNECGFPKTAFLPQKTEEPRNSFREWIRQSGLVAFLLRKNQTKQLLDRIADTPRSRLALEFRILPPLTV